MQKAKKGGKRVVKKSAAVKLMETLIGRKLLAGQKKILALIEPMFESVNEDIRALEQSHNNDVDGLVKSIHTTKKDITETQEAALKDFGEVNEAFDTLSERVNDVDKRHLEIRDSHADAINSHEARLGKHSLRLSAVEKRIPNLTKIDQDLKIMENGWMLQARVIEGLHAEDKRLGDEIDRFLGRVDHCEGRQANMLGRIVMGEKKTHTLISKVDFLGKLILHFRLEAWYWTIMTSSALGIAFGLLAVISSKTL